jgi:hypothetical protein
MPLLLLLFDKKGVFEIIAIAVAIVIFSGIFIVSGVVTICRIGISVCSVRPIRTICVMT